MRRILVETARRKRREKHGGGLVRADLLERDAAIDPRADEVLAVDEALSRLEQDDAQAGKLLKLVSLPGSALTRLLMRWASRVQPPTDTGLMLARG